MELNTEWGLNIKSDNMCIYKNYVQCLCCRHHMNWTNIMDSQCITCKVCGREDLVNLVKSCLKPELGNQCAISSYQSSVATCIHNADKLSIGAKLLTNKTEKLK